MAETLMICSKGTMNAINSSLLTATMLKGQGVDVAVFFYQEAVVSFAERKFEIPPLLAKYTETMFRNIGKTGLPTDTMEILKMAKGAGVPVYICSIWADILDVRDKLPAELEVVETADAVKLFAEAKRHIGA